MTYHSFTVGRLLRMTLICVTILLSCCLLTACGGKTPSGDTTGTDTGTASEIAHTMYV